jgi:hypothetical protein
MNDLLELSKTFVAAGWIYLCIVFAIALGLMLFDRRRRAPRSPEPGPAAVMPRDPFRRTPTHDPIAADRA